MTESPFGVTWNELTLDHLRTFFEDVDPLGEPVTWEAKGTKLIHANRVRREVVRFANQFGGYLVLGASSDRKQWVVNGVDFGDREPRTWLEQVARSGLSPVPEIEAKSWPAESGRHVAVLRVEPVAVPPCIWDGRVYQRVSGASEPVTNQAVLLELTTRGKAARERARKAAGLRAMYFALSGHESFPPPVGRFALAIAPTAPDRDFTPRIFTASWTDTVLNALRVLADIPLGLAATLGQVRIDHIRDHLRVGLTDSSGAARWIAQSFDDGAVVIGWESSNDRTTVTDAAGEYRLGGIWTEAAHLVQELGGLAPGYLAVATEGRGRGSTGLKRTPEPLVHELTDFAPPSRESLGKLERRLLREHGLRADESELPTDD